MISRVDADHGDFHPVFAKMAAPRYLTETQIPQLRTATQLPAPEQLSISNGELPPQGLAMIEFR
jgi:beta-xylosidase